MAPGGGQPLLDALGDQPPLEVGDRAEDVEHQFAGGRRGVDPLLEAGEVDAAGLEFPDRPQQLRQRAPQPVEAGHAQAVAWPRMVNQPGQLRPIGGCAGDDVGEDADRSGPLQPVVLPRRVLVSGGDARVAEDVARPANDRFRDGFRHGHSAALPGPRKLSLYPSPIKSPSGNPQRRFRDRFPPDSEALSRRTQHELHGHDCP